MEPGLRGREDPAPARATPHGPPRPLWSPAFGAGKTVHPDGVAVPLADAAMEPGLRGREDAPAPAASRPARRRRYGARPSGPGRRAAVTVTGGRGGWCRYGARPSGPGRRSGRPESRRSGGPAAMEPGLRGREDLDLPASAGLVDHRAAMEPGLRGREDRSPPCTPRSRCAGRYGARPSGPGRPRPRTRCPATSPGRYGARPSGPGRRSVRPRMSPTACWAAMEPGLRGREDGRRTPPRRSRRRRRYGARPSGPGRPGQAAVVPLGVGEAAMEPGLRGREDHRCGAGEVGADRAAMEPGLRGREDARGMCSLHYGRWKPLWSPAFGAGKTRWPVPPSSPSSRRRYGARPSGPGRPPAEPPGPRKATPPLWSPAFGAGKTRGGQVVGDAGQLAAMEPGLRGREDATPGVQGR